MNPQFVTALRQRYETALFNGNSAEAGSVIDQALAAPDFAPDHFFSEVIAPAQTFISGQSQSGAIGVAEERRAINITLEQLVRLRQVIKPRERIRRRAMIFTAGCEGDGLGGRMLADLLYWDGWDVDFLGANLPGSEAALFAGKSRVDLVGVALPYNKESPPITEVISEIVQLDPRPKVLVGGIMSDISTLTESLPVDAVVQDLRLIAESARKLVGLTRGSAVPEEVLKSVGERLRTARKQLGYSQQEVSDICTLDRAYLSELENGKQNATIGALIKVTSALDLSLRDLFS